MSQVVAFSGVKDSTAMALRMAEMGEDFDLLFTPTGNEMPDVLPHIERIVQRTGKRLIVPPNRSLEEWINEFSALPNHRQRWCTRLIKITPCIAWLMANPGTVLCVGLRADEDNRTGLYGDFATYRYPLREWGWNLEKTLAYCDAVNADVPPRTDCAVCPYQRLGDWWRLWRDYPVMWAQGEAWEEQTGYTFRSKKKGDNDQSGRDTWPASMKGLRERFERGDKPDRALARERTANTCRVCSM